MGVGDYIHSKEAPQLRPPTRDAPNKSRQLLAEQAKVDIPATAFAPAIPHGVNGSVPLGQQQNGPSAAGLPRAPYEEPPQGDMFDTDVEGVDDSTIAATTVLDPEDEQEIQLSRTRQAKHTDTDSRPLHHLRPGNRLYGSNWYENLGDKAMKTAGFDSDDADDDASQLTSSLADDDEKASESTDWYYSHKRRPDEEPLSKRLEGFWNASKRTYPKPSNPAQNEPNLHLVPPAYDFIKPAGQGPPIRGGRKITLLRSRTATPRARTRFSPPKPSLLEQLDMSPTHRPSGQSARRTRKKGTGTPLPNGMDDAGLLTSDNGHRENVDTVTAFDITNLDVLDNDDEDTMQDPFLKRSSTNRAKSFDATVPKKREFEADYPPAILYQKSLSDLQAESFDYTPPAASPHPEIEEPQPNDAEDKVSLLLRLSDQDRANFLSNMPIDDWEECGDQLVEKFTLMLSRMKDLRRARRKTVALFEAEIKRRHELVESQASELSCKLDDMRTGSAEVLRGRGHS